MRRSAVALVVLALAASTAQGAQAKQACPTLTDDAGDTNVLGFQVQQDTSDITSASVSTANKTLTAKVTVVGQPVNNEPGVSRLYDIYFDNGEGDFVLRGTLGNGENLFQLVTHTQLADAGPGVGTADHWQAGKTLQGRVHDHTVTISAPLDRDFLPTLDWPADAVVPVLEDKTSITASSASTLVRIDEDRLTVLRPGPVTLDDLDAFR